MPERRHPFGVAGRQPIDDLGQIDVDPVVLGSHPSRSSAPSAPTFPVAPARYSSMAVPSPGVGAGTVARPRCIDHHAGLPRCSAVAGRHPEVQPRTVVERLGWWRTPLAERHPGSAGDVCRCRRPCRSRRRRSRRPSPNGASGRPRPAPRPVEGGNGDIVVRPRSTTTADTNRQQQQRGEGGEGGDGPRSLSSRLTPPSSSATSPCSIKTPDRPSRQGTAVAVQDYFASFRSCVHLRSAHRARAWRPCGRWPSL